MKNDLEEGQQEAEDHPNVDQLHVRGLRQRGRRRHEERRDDEHSGQAHHDPRVVVLHLEVVGQVDGQQQASGGQIRVEHLIAHSPLQFNGYPRARGQFPAPAFEIRPRNGGVEHPVFQQVLAADVLHRLQPQRRLVLGGPLQPELHEAVLHVERVFLQLEIAREFDGVFPKRSQRIFRPVVVLRLAQLGQVHEGLSAAAQNVRLGRRVDQRDLVAGRVGEDDLGEPQRPRFGRRQRVQGETGLEVSVGQSGVVPRRGQHEVHGQLHLVDVHLGVG